LTEIALVTVHSTVHSSATPEIKVLL